MPFIHDFFTGGFLGVDVFFVLSGFLITALLLREQADHGGVCFGSFYARRALRLLPALFVLLMAHAIYARIAHLPSAAEISTIRAAIFYYVNWYGVWHVFGVAQGLGHLWSLAIEEQFYLVWPTVLVLFLGLRRKTTRVTVILVAAIVTIGVHPALMWEHGTSWLFIFLRTDTRADSLLVGALLACLWVRRRTPTKGLFLQPGSPVVCFSFVSSSPGLTLGSSTSAGSPSSRSRSRSPSSSSSLPRSRAHGLAIVCSLFLRCERLAGCPMGCTCGICPFSLRSIVTEAVGLWSFRSSSLTVPAQRSRPCRGF